MDMVTKQCGGHLLIQSRKGKGTVVEAAFAKDNIDRPPLGDIVSSIKVLLVGTPYLELKFIYKIGTSGLILIRGLSDLSLVMKQILPDLKFIHGLKNI